MLNTGKVIGGKRFYVHDCYIWAEIQYLDSATDYRESLPDRPIPRRPIIDSELTMLNSSGDYTALTNWIPALALFVVSAGIIGWLLHL